MKHLKNKRGFTLVELSIVLVIIGLLIGGILVAQSMVNTARISATVRQLGQFDAAVANFYTKYNQLPGDDNIMGAVTGNIDGYISGTTASNTALTFGAEIGKFWYDLSTSGLRPTGGSLSTYVDDSTPSTTTFTQLAMLNTVIPQIPLGTNLGAIAFSSTIGTSYYELSAFTVTSSAITVTPANGLRAIDALALDTKIDDGVGNSGNVQASDKATLSSAVTGTTCQNAGVYTLTATTPVCSAVIRIGAQTGNLQ